MWTHTVLEIYQDPDAICSEVDGDGWPTGSSPADWIEQGLVGYCQGETKDLVSSIPLWKLLWWRVQDWVHRLRVVRGGVKWKLSQ